MSEIQIKFVSVYAVAYRAMAMEGRASAAHVNNRRVEEDVGSQSG